LNTIDKYLIVFLLKLEYTVSFHVIHVVKHAFTNTTPMRLEPNHISY